MKIIYGLSTVFSLLATLAHSDLVHVVYSGNYIIAGCGDNANTVVTVLQQLVGGLKTALQTPSTSTVYSKFFKGVDPNIVNTVLTKISLGTDVLSNGRTWQPTIICPTADMPEIVDHFNLCQNTQVQGTHQRNTQYVFLCDRIFDLKTVPDKEDCVGPLGNGMLSTGQGLARSVMAILLHELVHMYLDPQRLPRDYYGIHAVLDLPAEKSTINPPNYVFYIANIMAKCTTFNPPEYLRPHERILLWDGMANTTLPYRVRSGFDVVSIPQSK